MERKKLFRRYIILLNIAIFITLTACSYVVDMVERTITKRASFSISATYDPGTRSVTLSWRESPGGNFAGYEVYMTEYPDDEYSGYTIVAGPNNLGPPLSGQPYYDNSPFLSNSGKRSYVFDSVHLYEKLQFDGVITPGTTVRYFFRLGIINWDEDQDERTSKNGYTGNTFQDYCAHTDIGEISGSAVVDIISW